MFGSVEGYAARCRRDGGGGERERWERKERSYREMEREKEAKPRLWRVVRERRELTT
jgi:hypothetical protein